MFMVTTTEGVRVFAGTDGGGLTEAQAAVDAAVRNKRAVENGYAARYQAAPYVSLKEKK